MMEHIEVFRLNCDSLIHVFKITNRFAIIIRIVRGISMFVLKKKFMRGFVKR